MDVGCSDSDVSVVVPVGFDCFIVHSSRLLYNFIGMSYIFEESLVAVCSRCDVGASSTADETYVLSADLGHVPILTSVSLDV